MNEKELKKLKALKKKEVNMLRKNVDMKKYEQLQDFNKHDVMYKWAFDYDDVLKEDIKDIEAWASVSYTIDILNVYIELLYSCQRERGNK